VAGPRTIHQAVGFVLLVFLEEFQSTFVQFRISAAGIKRGHAAYRVSSVLVANLRQECAELLEKRHIVRDGIAVRQNPIGVFEHEVGQRGHVVPAA
jgi:hypothetical protein